MSSDDPSTTLDITRQLRDVVAEMGRLLEKNNAAMRDAASISEKLRDAFTSSADGLTGVSSKLSEITKSLGEVSDKASGVGDSFSSVGEAATGLESKFSTLERMGSAAGTRLSTGFKLAAVGIKTITAGLGRAWTQVKAVYQTFKSFYMVIQSIAMTTFKTLINAMNNLQALGAGLADKFRQLKEAQQEIVETFGSLSSNEGRAVQETFDGIANSAENLGGSGRSLESIYGYGVDGLAQAMKDVNEVARDMGPLFNGMRKEFEESGAEILVFQKGLGLTNEQLKGLASQAKSRGKSVMQVEREIGNLALQMSKKFSISSKTIGKDLGYMTQNSGKFGKMMKETATASIVYLNQLGLSIQDVEGLISKWDDFESAAKGATTLAQGFGMYVDSVKMFNEEDPAKRLDMLRQSFSATGRSAETLSRLERQLLADTAGLDANMIELALSNKNAGKSYDEILKSAKESGQVQMTQEEIMQDLAKSIKEVIRPIQYVGGLISNFFSGFAKGWGGQDGEKSPLMKAIAKAIEMFEKVGYTVGKMFNVFEQKIPLFNWLKQYYDKLAVSVSKVEGIFKKFFDSTKSGGGSAKTALATLLEELKNEFVWLFDQQSPINKGIKEGLIQVGKFVFGILVDIGNQMLPWISDAILKGLDQLSVSFVDGIRNFGKKTETKAGKTFGDLLSSIFNLALKVVGKLFSLFVSGFVASLENRETRYKVLAALTALFLFVTVPAALAGASALVGGLITAFGTLLPLAMKNPAMREAIIKATKPVLEKTFAYIFKSFLPRLISLVSISLKAMLGPLYLIGLGVKFIFVQMIGLIGKILPKGFGVVMSWIGVYAKALGGKIGGFLMGTVMKRALSWLFGWEVLVVEYLARGLRLILDWIGRDAFVSIMGSFGGQLFDTIHDGLDLLIGVFEDVFGGLWDIVIGFFKMFTGDFSQISGGFMKLIRAVGRLVALAINNTVGIVYKVIKEKFGVPKFLEDIVNGFWGWVMPGEEAKEAASAAGSEVGSSVASGLNDSLEEGGKSAEEKLSGISSMVGDYAEKTTQEVSRQVADLNKGIRNIEFVLNNVDKQAMDRIKILLDKFDYSFVEGANSFVEKMNESVPKLADSLSILADAIAKIASVGIQDLSSNIRMSMSNIGRSLEAVGDGMGFVKNGWGRILPYAYENYHSATAAIVEEINLINKELESLQSFDVEVKMEKIGDDIGVKNAVFDFTRKPMNVTINLNVEMDAKELTSNVSRTAVTMVNNGDKKIVFPTRGRVAPRAVPAAAGLAGAPGTQKV